MGENRGELTGFITEALASLAKMDSKLFTEHYRAGGGNPFAPLFDEFERIKTLATAAAPLDANLLPLKSVQELSAAAQNMWQAVEKIRTFSPIGQNANYDGIVRDNFKNAAAKFCDALVPLFGVAAAQKLASQGGAEDEFRKSMAHFHATLHSEISSVEESLKALKQGAVEAGASQEATHFDEEATGHRTASLVWLGIAVLLAGGMLWFMAHAYQHPMTQATFTPEVIQKLITKVVILSLASGFLVFAGRNYATSRHNYVINRHRAKALATFRAFVNGTSDNDIKNQVLLHAARAVFSTPSSGYLRKDAGVQLGGPLLEMVSAIKPKS